MRSNARHTRGSPARVGHHGLVGCRHAGRVRGKVEELGERDPARRRFVAIEQPRPRVGAQQARPRLGPHG